MDNIGGAFLGRNHQSRHTILVPRVQVYARLRDKIKKDTYYYGLVPNDESVGAEKTRKLYHSEEFLHDVGMFSFSSNEKSRPVTHPDRIYRCPL